MIQDTLKSLQNHFSVLTAWTTSLLLADFRHKQHFSVLRLSRLGGGATQKHLPVFHNAVNQGKCASVSPTTDFTNLWTKNPYLSWKISILTFFHWIVGNRTLLLVIRGFVLLPLSYLGHCLMRTVLQIFVAFDLTKSPDTIFMNLSQAWFDLHKCLK